MRGTRAVLFALAVLAAGCSAGGDDPAGDAADAAPTASSSTAPAPTSTPSAADAPAGAPAAGDPACDGRAVPDGRLQAVESSGGERTFLLDVPAGYDATEPAPVVLDFHGFGSNAEEQAIYSGLGPAGTERGYVVVTPQGLGDPARWVFIPPEGGGVDDVVFAGDLLDHLEATLCVDPDRLYSAGMSNGAALSARLACQLGDRLAAVATVTANFYSPDCARESPVSVISFHGTADAIVPYEGGPIGGGAAAAANGLPVPPEEASMQAWADHSGCDGPPDVGDAAPGVVRHDWAGCDDGTDVVLYEVEGGGHTWPGAIDVGPLGETTHEISATELVLDFFDDHPRA